MLADNVCSRLMMVGSDLHIYRGHQPGPYGYVMVRPCSYIHGETGTNPPLPHKGHEFVGEVVEIGGEITDFKVGDRVVSLLHNTILHNQCSIRGKYHILGLSLHYFMRCLLLLRKRLDLSLHPISIVRLWYTRRCSSRICARPSSR